MSAPFMSFHGECTAPIFDPAQPNTLRQYFAQLEALFARCQVASELEKKEYATSYLSWNVAEGWEALPQYTDASETYANFKDRLFDLYNQSDLRYTYGDLTQFISNQSRLNIQSLQSLSEFHLRFIAISTHLLNLGIISKREQSQMYLQVFDLFLRSKIELRLQIQFPEHPAAHPHPIDAILEAAQWILRDPSSTHLCPALTPSPPNVSPPMRTFSDENASTVTAKKSLAAPARNSGFNDSDLSNTTLRSVSTTNIDTLDAPKVQHTYSEPIAPQTNISSHSTLISNRFARTSTPTPISLASTSLLDRSAMVYTAPASRPRPTTPLEVQTRIKEIEDEIRTLRAQSHITTIGTTPNRSVKLSYASYSLSPPLRNISPASSTPTRSAQISNTLHITNRISSIVNPASFVYQGKLYQATLWTPKKHISSAPSISTTQTSPTPIISTCAIPDTPTLQISTSQPPDTLIAIARNPIQLPLVPQSRTPALAASRSAMSTRISVLPTLTSPFNSAIAFLAILRTIARLSFRSTLPYIRNHARLKTTWYDLDLK